jgi:7,8-dihydropterin-6-yl-methyl-4-(beta-D-ribofuranosyl)aminobenzene 5'-phosphate synthase
MSDIRTSRITRRRFVQTATLGTLVYAVRRGSATAALEVPSVDALSIHTIVDNATFGPFLADVELPGLRIERAREPGRERVSPKALMAEFGLSLLAESHQGAQARRVLIDFGHTAEALANNLALLGINPVQIDAAVLSHGHLDHYGGFPGLFASAPEHRRSIPLIVGGEETFCERVAMVGGAPLIMGMLQRSDLARAGLDVIIDPTPRVVADHAFTTGIIPLASAERAAIPTHMRPGVGCSAAELTAAKRDLAQLPDDGEHELATWYAVNGLGLVVIASCSHRGVINSIRHSQAISGIQKVHAVVGGFHLIRPRTDDEARWTVDELVRIDPTYVIPMHCSGDVFIDEARRTMPEKLIRPYVGTKFIFSAA